MFWLDDDDSCWFDFKNCYTFGAVNIYFFSFLFILSIDFVGTGFFVDNLLRDYFDRDLFYPGGNLFYWNKFWIFRLEF